jgi:hypothetical protein
MLWCDTEIPVVVTTLSLLISLFRVQFRFDKNLIYEAALSNLKISLSTCMKYSNYSESNVGD